MKEDKASRFHRRKRWAQVGAAAAGASLLVAWMASGASALVRDLARALAHAVVTSEPNVAIVEVAVYVIILSLSLSLVLALPRRPDGGLCRRGDSRGKSCAW